MPLYAFTCAACGPFEERRPLSAASDPTCCPRCQQLGQRIYTPPGLVRTPASLRSALGREEQSAHEPEVATGPVSSLPGRPLPRPHHPTPPWTLGH